MELAPQLVLLPASLALPWQPVPGPGFFGELKPTHPLCAPYTVDIEFDSPGRVAFVAGPLIPGGTLLTSHSGPEADRQLRACRNGDS